jgi:hypothetical protein
MDPREELIGELQRTVEGVADAADSAARERIERMAELGDELIERAAVLAAQLEALSDAVAESARSFRRELGIGEPAEPAEPAQPAEAETGPIQDWTSLDEIDEARAAIERSRTPLLHRFRREASEIPEGVRLVVTQMRMAGERESEIVRRLEDMGVDDPANVIARVE